MKGGRLGEPHEGFSCHPSSIFSLLKIRHRTQGELSEKIGREEMYASLKLMFHLLNKTHNFLLNGLHLSK